MLRPTLHVLFEQGRTSNDRQACCRGAASYGKQTICRAQPSGPEITASSSLWQPSLSETTTTHQPSPIRDYRRARPHPQPSAIWAEDGYIGCSGGENGLYDGWHYHNIQTASTQQDILQVNMTTCLAMLPRTSRGLPGSAASQLEVAPFFS